MCIGRKEDMKKYLTIVGSRIKMCRKMRNMTQEELARRAHTSKSAISRIEKGEKSLSLEELYALAKALKIGCSELASDEILDQVPEDFVSELKGSVNMYCFSSDRTRTVHSVIGFCGGHGLGEATLYYDVKDETLPENCAQTYTGGYKKHDVIVYFNGTNLLVAADKASAVAKLNPDGDGHFFGVVQGLRSGTVNRPCSFEALFSREFLTPDAAQDILRRYVENFDLTAEAAE
jgi:transcriptional regulator with XRE-family HTH domain